MWPLIEANEEGTLPLSPSARASGTETGLLKFDELREDITQAPNLYSPSSLLTTIITISPSHSPSPLLALSPEVRLQIFTYIFQSAFRRTFSSSRRLIIHELPWVQSHPSLARSLTPRVLSLFLINWLLHDEAEEALWKNFKIILQSYWHYKFPLRDGPGLKLSAYAYGSIRRLYMPLHVAHDNHFLNVRTNYNPLIDTGDYASSTGQETWRFAGIARRLTGLKEITLAIFTGTEDEFAAPSRSRKRAVEVVVGIVGLFDVEKRTVLVETLGWKVDMVRECKYRTKKHQEIKVKVVGFEGGRKGDRGAEIWNGGWKDVRMEMKRA